MEFNAYQTPIEDLGLPNLPSEIVEQFYSFLTNVPYIQSLVAPDRKRAKDLPRDSEGKIIVDITHPHILENMEYFTETARNFRVTGKFTNFRPNPNPNSEFGKWIYREVDRIYNGMVRPEDGEWIPGDLYFFWNYYRMVITENTRHNRLVRKESFPSIWDGHYLKFHYIDQARSAKKHCAELAARGRGKAHPYNEVVYTPEGKKLWGDIKIGDSLFGDDGKITKVIDIPFMGVAPIYKISFADGESIECSEGHLWKVRSHCLNKEVIVSVKELLQMFKRPRTVTERCPKGYELDCTVLNNKGVDFAFAETKIDPYTMGLLLGDGCLRVKRTATKARITAVLEDFEIYKNIVPYSYVHYRGKECAHAFNIENFGNVVKEYGLYMVKSEDKFIPEEYKYNSREVRVNLLKGILDSDGTVHNSGHKISICLSSKKMVEDIKWICNSLGIPCGKICEKKTFYIKKDGTRKDCLTAYRMSIFSDICLFNLPRKIELWNKRGGSFRSKSRYVGVKITNIEYIGEKLCKCVTVDNNSHCYLIGNFITTHNSYSLASQLLKRFVFGEDEIANRLIRSFVLAYSQEYLDKDGILNKFQSALDFLAEYTEFPTMTLKKSWSDLHWKLGYKDLDSGLDKGLQNEVLGVATASSIDKVRGKRGSLIGIEEFGSFKNLLELYQVLLPSVQLSDIEVFGQILLQGTAGSKESDFASAQELMYNPDGYNIYSVDNVYDKLGQGKKKFVYFFPAYLCRGGYIGMSGNSDVTAALISILKERYRVKYNASDPSALVKTIAENPITPSEAIMKVKGTLFPVTQLTERLNQIDSDPAFYDNVACGNLVMKTDGTVEFSISKETPIREFPLRDNKAKGCIEIYSKPEKKGNQVIANRYIGGIDPVDNDQSGTLSLVSCFILDVWTDNIVAEYTGRMDFADDCYEVIRRMLLYYNATALYENNLKGIYTYFLKMNCLYLLADTPAYLKDRQIIKTIGIGNTSKGVNATAGVNAYADTLIRDWLLRPYPCVFKKKNELGETVLEETTMPNLYRLMGRALIKELIADDGIINVDRVRALGMLMLYREGVMVNLGGDVKRETQEENDLANDPFFKINYDDRFKQNPVFPMRENT